MQPLAQVGGEAAVVAVDLVEVGAQVGRPRFQKRQQDGALVVGHAPVEVRGLFGDEIGVVGVHAQVVLHDGVLVGTGGAQKRSA